MMVDTGAMVSVIAAELVTHLRWLMHEVPEGAARGLRGFHQESGTVISILGHVVLGVRVGGQEY